MPFQNYFNDSWNVFDFIIVLGSVIDITYSEWNVSHMGPRPALFSHLIHTSFIFKQNYFADSWNVFDTLIVLGSVIDITVAEVKVSM